MNSSNVSDELFVTGSSSVCEGCDRTRCAFACRSRTCEAEPAPEG